MSSRMQATFTLETPDDALATATITMPIGDWKRLRTVLNGDYMWPASDLSRLISDLVRQAETKFSEKQEQA